MGHTSKFTFPMPGWKSKPAPSPSPQAATPRTKAQKILGTGGINTDASMLSPDSKWGWETRSNSGISIAISETTASYTDGEATGLGILQEGEVAGAPAARKGRWEDESDIIPRGIHGQGNAPVGLTGPDAVTDASSLRRRQSNSTITSYYDKSKLPLSISQQTSNSAMAKGLPTKAHALLDIEGAYAEQNEKGKGKKKKPSRLDLSALLSRPKSSKYLRPDTYKGLVLGPDMMTKSPSIMSASPDATPPPIQQRTDRSLRSKLTKDSLRDAPPVPELPQHAKSSPASRNGLGSRGEARGHRPTKSTVDLLNLYDHYEQRSFADVLEQDATGELSADRDMPMYPTPPASSSGGGFLSPLSSNAVRIAHPGKQVPLMGSANDLSLVAGTSPPSLISPPGDTASISSRHTRTSKASRRTDRSLTDIDLQQNSVLSLSSDSEDDGYEHSPKSSLAVPAFSDGQASPTSPRSAISQRSAATVPQESSRGKLPKRTSFATQPQFLPIPEGAATGNLPKINARSSSLSLNAAAPKPRPSMLHQTSRLSINTTSTGRTVSVGTIPIVRANSVAGNSPPRQPSWSATGVSRFDDFPSPPTHRSQRSSVTVHSPEQPTPPLSPTSVDFYMQSRPNSRATVDTQSIRSGRSLGSMVKGVLRGSTVSTQQDENSGRFMAVTRQEEMLLAALRLKRARMREDIIAEFEDKLELDGEEEEQLHRQTTNGSEISRQSSASTMRTVEAGAFASPLSARPQHPQIRVSSGSGDKNRMDKGTPRGQILLMMDRSAEDSIGIETAEPSPDLDGFLGFDDESLGFPTNHHPERRGSKASSKASMGSASGGSTKSRKTALSVTSAGSRSKAQPKEALLPRRDADQVSLRSGSFRGSEKEMIAEDPREADAELDVPRPDSPISPADFPTPVAMTRKKQVRLSAVGNYKPNIEAGWWDDSG